MKRVLLVTWLSGALVLEAISTAETTGSAEAIHHMQQDCKQKTQQGQYEEALPVCLGMVSLQERTHPDHPDLATALNALGELYYYKGAPEQAEPLYRRSLLIREKALGPDHPDVAASLNNLAVLYQEQGAFKQIEPILLRSLRIREKALGPDHPDVAESLINLGFFYEKKGEWKQAEQFYGRSLQILEKALGPEHHDVASCLNTIAQLYRSQGNYAQAEQFYRRSLRILERVLGPDHPDVAAVLINLGSLYDIQGDYRQAEPLLLRSLRIREKALGLEHPKVGESLHNLAEFYRTQGTYKQAEPLYLRTLHIEEKAFGPEHPDVATVLCSLASLYQDQGAYNQAEPLYMRSLRIREKAFGPNHSDVAESLNDLGMNYRLQGEYEKADIATRRSLQIWERTLGPQHSYFAIGLNNLGLLYFQQAEYQQALTLYQRSVRIQEKALGPDNPLVAASLLNLALTYQAQGSYRESELFFQRSLRIYEKAFGPEHPAVANNLQEWATLEVAIGQRNVALAHFNRALTIRERTLRQAATEVRVTSLLNQLRREEDKIYSLLLLPGASAETVRLALRTSLLHKGRAVEAGLLTGWSIQQSVTSPEQRQRFERWQALRGQHEAMFLRGPGRSTLAAHQESLINLRNQIAVMESELARAAPQLAMWKLPEPEQVIEAVADTLSWDSAFVEMLQIKPFQFAAKDKEPRWGEPRYVALLLFPGARVDWVDLGAAATLDQATGEFLLAVRNLEREPLVEARALYEAAVAPLVAKLGKARRLLISPDGSLNLVPLAALHDGRRYLLDSEYQIRYVTSGRDLLRRELPAAHQPALVLADPDFAGRGVQATSKQPASPDKNLRSLYESLSSLTPLPGARAEGQAVAALLRVVPSLGAAATESRLRATRAPSVLHIATHGLLLDDLPGDGRGPRSKLVSSAPDQVFERATGRSGDYSLSRSALALAGAAQAEGAADAKEDGLLTAEEARSLDLYGTQLVVLSACDTGRGAVRVGQGVYGLRRAFWVAGAEAVVMSLWPVSDGSTRSLMQRYYGLLLDKDRPRPRINALAEAMRAVKAEHAHPYYWAPFIADGIDTPLPRSDERGR